MRKLIGIFVILVVLLGGFFLFSSASGPSVAEFRGLGAKYSVKILRDTWGVPHIYGKTDADTAFGLAYAHAEDDMPTTIDALLAARGQLASVKGKDSAPIDFMVNLLRVWDDIDAKYETDLSPETRAICEAYANGLNYYAALHESEVPGHLLPFTGKDVVAGFVFKGPFFYGLDNAVQELFGPERKRSVSEKNPAQATADFLYSELEIGSNTFAVSPKRSADGSTFLNINSHQPWEGPVAWYEAHLHSEQGWDIVGGTFPGAPLILHGHNRDLGWAHTVNKPDLIDVYVLDINPENPNQYKFDGQWKDLEERTAKIKVKILGPISWTVKRPVYWSVYGPTLKQDHGTYAIRYANMGDIRQAEQWYRMGKAKNFAEWKNAMAMQSVASLNCGYADREGNIYYLYNAKLPKRAEGYDWKQYLPGDTSETLWTEFYTVEENPQVLNPESGFVLNCNSTPFKATADGENPLESEFAKSMGIETHMTNRGLRAMELLSADTSITEHEFIEYKYDMAYSADSEIAKGWKRIAEAELPDDPIIKEALEVWKKWDLKVNPENTSAAICVLTIGPGSDNDPRAEDIAKTFELIKNTSIALKLAHGKIDVPWSEVNRLRRGDIDMGLGGGPDILHAVYGSRVVDGKVDGLENGEIYGRAGDCYVLLATWDKDGKVRSQSIHQYGSASVRTNSKHYADQAPLFCKRELKPVWLDEADIRANLQSEYKPGEEMI
ncbi:MAG: acylase [Candidatus Hydrogenedentes bacterium]|nr:acylase [Candidatus Hydrogenedentota bacterium]